MGDKEDRLNRQLDAAWKKLERAQKQDVKGYHKAIMRSTVTFLLVYCDKDKRERQSNTMECYYKLSCIHD